jgi:ABC-type sugar transport system, periplasmic component
MVALATSSSFAASKQGGTKFAFFIAHQGNEFMASLAKDVAAAAQKRGVTCKVYSADNDPAKQASQIDEAVAMQVDGIIIDPVSFDGASSAIKAAVDAKIPVITLHQQVSNQNICNGYVGVNIKGYGIQLMQQCVKDLGGKGNVAIMNGHMGETAQIDLTAGFKEVIAKNPGIKLVFEGSGNWVKEDAIRLTENWLSTGKHIDAIVCHNDGMGEGVMQVVKTSNLAGKIKIYGTDAQPDALRGIKAGEYTATIRNDSVTLGIKGIDAIIRASQGKKIEKALIVPSIVVNKDNVDQYLQ